MQTSLENGMSSTVWDDRGWFGLIEKNKKIMNGSLSTTLLR